MEARKLRLKIIFPALARLVERALAGISTLFYLRESDRRDSLNCMKKPERKYAIYRNGIRIAGDLTIHQVKRRFLDDASEFDDSPRYTIVCNAAEIKKAARNGNGNGQN